MVTLKEQTINEIEIKRSRFITNMKYVKDEMQAKDFINEIRQLHPNATHNCTVYKCGQVIRVDDDGEPNKTAAIPMLEVLNHHDLDFICVVVTRYFGGIKLGAGGLIRAYAKAVSEAIKVAKVQELVEGYRLKIKASYNETKAIEYLLKNSNYQHENTEYEMNVNYYVLVDIDQKVELEKKLNEINHLIKVEELAKIFVAKQGEDNEK